MKRIIFTGLIILLTGIATQAQVNGQTATQQTDQTQQTLSVVFRFDAQSDKFFARGNEAELKRLYEFVDRHKAAILDGQIPVYVNGYCVSFAGRRDNLKTAALRSNRVKSELITNKGLAEKHFITANHTASYDGLKEAVTVSFTVKQKQQQPQTQQTPPQEQQPSQGQSSLQQQSQESQQSQKQQQPSQESPQSQSSQNQPQSRQLSLRTNLLLWATATPNIGVEWQPAANVGILLNSAFSHWIWSSDERQHRTWLIQPEIRYYFSNRAGWFIGVEAHIAQFNLKFNDTGYQGDILGGGLTGGYRLQLNRRFDMDFSLGFGYTNIKYDSYYRSNNVMVKKEVNQEKNIFTPTQAGVGLIVNF